MQFKIPPHLSKKFKENVTEDEKQKFINSYKYWYNHEFTKDFIEHMELLLEESVKEEDKEFSFSTLFESKYTHAARKGERNFIRKILKQLNYEV